MEANTVKESSHMPLLLILELYFIFSSRERSSWGILVFFKPFLKKTLEVSLEDLGYTISGSVDLSNVISTDGEKCQDFLPSASTVMHFHGIKQLSRRSVEPPWTKFLF